MIAWDMTTSLMCFMFMSKVFVIHFRAVVRTLSFLSFFFFIMKRCSENSHCEGSSHHKPQSNAIHHVILHRFQCCMWYGQVHLSLCTRADVPLTLKLLSCHKTKSMGIYVTLDLMSYFSTGCHILLQAKQWDVLNNLPSVLTWPQNSLSDAMTPSQENHKSSHIWKCNS